MKFKIYGFCELLKKTDMNIHDNMQMIQGICRKLKTNPEVNPKDSDGITLIEKSKGAIFFAYCQDIKHMTIRAEVEDDRVGVGFSDLKEDSQQTILIYFQNLRYANEKDAFELEV